jgi:DNA repair protein SbcD/Mre11
MGIKILATADLHLGRAASGLPEDAPERSTKYTWERLVGWSVQHKVHLLLLAGDIVDEENRYFEAIGPLQSGFERLKKEGIEVFMVAGNHDHGILSQIVDNNQYEHVHMLGSDGKWESRIFSTGEQHVRITGWSFTQKYVTEGPLEAAGQIDHDRNTMTIGMLHGDTYALDSKYAPLNPDHLAEMPVDAWILGHIHKPVELKASDPYIAYTGSPHALNPGEPGMHGPLFIDIADKQSITIKRIPISPVRYETITIPIDRSVDAERFRDLLSGELFQAARNLIPQLESVAYLIYDVILEGENTSIEVIDNWKQQILDYETELETGTRVYVRKVVNRGQPAVDNLEELAEQLSPAGKLAETILAIQKSRSTPFLNELIQDWFSNVKRVSEANVYHTLRKASRIPEGQEAQAREYILEECNRLLGALLAQQKKEKV